MNIMHSCSFGSTVEINEVEVVDIRRSFLDIAPVRSMQFSLAAIAMGDVSVPVWELEEGHWGTTGGINMEGPQETSATNRLFHGCLPPPPPPPHTHTLHLSEQVPSCCLASSHTQSVEPCIWSKHGSGTGSPAQFHNQRGLESPPQASCMRVLHTASPLHCEQEIYSRIWRCALLEKGCGYCIAMCV